jgi:ribosome recycling factor
MSIENIDDLQLKFEEIVEQFQTELKKMKTGRANAGLVESVQVDCFGTRMPLLHIATINVLDARTIEISPWNKDQLKEIKKAISNSDLGLNPSEDGQVIRITIPPMTEERRLEMVKQLGKKSEEAKIRMRRNREDFWNKIQKQEKEGLISEDDKFKNKEDLQKLMDEYNRKIDEIEEKKREDLMQV